MAETAQRLVEISEVYCLPIETCAEAIEHGKWIFEV
jgi:hypothetical protein